ncbi:hypothetical protein NSK_002141 [Nannochloropsis salina CCMP1776]|uniref:Ribosome recycling factor domain-containing protein n=1 Tax=Nannochloropsis salina CCMP1776 TaxID=1027361 RepID=A0A4D9D655_9STRA|nr:hypothetical protein NSK_002141 [Nannochloropsis salina CCMP1776]|eukprot:TFJ86484.1 hypothetical protein NSK_002141 [Nannochloropsis salina CCMP1776]
MRASPPLSLLLVLLTATDAFFMGRIASTLHGAPKSSYYTKAIARRMAVTMEGEVADVQKEAEIKMKKSVDSTDNNLKGIRTGRASVTLLDRVMVDYFGSPTPLNQLAGVSVSGPQSLVVSPYDKSAFKLIETAILESSLGLNPNNEGSVLRLNIPPLTEDRRKELSKMAKGLAEEGKVAVRNVRRDAVERVKKLEKDKTIGKDESANGQEALQKLTDKYGKQLDEMLKSKEKEIMTV